MIARHETHLDKTDIVRHHLVQNIVQAYAEKAGGGHG